MTTQTVLPRATESFEAWYDAKDEDTQLLIDEINDRIHTGFDADEYEEFMALLDEYGITSAEQLEDALWYQSDAYTGSECEFAEYIETEINCTEIPSHLEGCIDWQIVWDSHYRFDFFSFTYKDTTYFFHNNF